MCHEEKYSSVALFADKFTHLTIVLYNLLFDADTIDDQKHREMANAIVRPCPDAQNTEFA